MAEVILYKNKIDVWGISQFLTSYKDYKMKMWKIVVLLAIVAIFAAPTVVMAENTKNPTTAKQTVTKKKHKKHRKHHMKRTQSSARRVGTKTA
jgi:hypothetical protein